MNTPHPLIPQGSLLELKKKRKSRILLTVFGIIALHVIPITGLLLMQGCKPEVKKTDFAGLEPTTNFLPAFDTNYLYATNEALPPTNVPATPESATSYVPPVLTNEPVAPLMPATTTTDYTVLRGDSFSKIARKLGVSVSAIAAANPGVDSTRLKIGQKLQVPVATSTTALPGAGAPADAGTTTYQVKSGDSLMKIARQHGTTVKAIRAANNLKTDRILVGQKLKLPPPSAKPGGDAARTGETPGVLLGPSGIDAGVVRPDSGLTPAPLTPSPAPPGGTV